MRQGRVGVGGRRLSVSLPAGVARDVDGVAEALGWSVGRVLVEAARVGLGVRWPGLVEGGEGGGGGA